MSTECQQPGHAADFRAVSEARALKAIRWPVTVIKNAFLNRAVRPCGSERQAFEDGFWNQFDSGHDVAPDSWGVEDIRGTAFEAPDDVIGVCTGPGLIVITRTPAGYRRLRSPWRKSERPPLAEPYR